MAYHCSICETELKEVTGKMGVRYRCPKCRRMVRPKEKESEDLTIIEAVEDSETGEFLIPITCYWPAGILELYYRAKMAERISPDIDFISFMVEIAEYGYAKKYGEVLSLVKIGEQPSDEMVSVYQRMDRLEATLVEISEGLRALPLNIRKPVKKEEEDVTEKE